MLFAVEAKATHNKNRNDSLDPSRTLELCGLSTRISPDYTSNIKVQELWRCPQKFYPWSCWIRSTKFCQVARKEQLLKGSVCTIYLNISWGVRYNQLGQVLVPHCQLNKRRGAIADRQVADLHNLEWQPILCMGLCQNLDRVPQSNPIYPYSEVPNPSGHIGVRWILGYFVSLLSHSIPTYIAISPLYPAFWRMIYSIPVVSPWNSHRKAHKILVFYSSSPIFWPWPGQGEGSQQAAGAPCC